MLQKQLTLLKTQVRTYDQLLILDTFIILKENLEVIVMKNFLLNMFSIINIGKGIQK